MPLRNVTAKVWATATPVLLVMAAWAGLAAWHGLAATATPSEGRGLPVGGAAWQAAGLPLAIALTFLIAFTQSMNRPASGRLLRALAVMGVAYATLAFVLHLGTPGQIFWYEKIQHKYALTGTFLNRNTAATFFGIATIIWLARTINFLGKSLQGDGSLLTRLGWLHSAGRRKLLRSVICLALCLAAVMATGSRAGLAATVVGIVAIALVSLKRLVTETSGRRMLVLSLLGVALLSGMFFMGGDLVLRRVSQKGLFDPLRFAIYTDSLDIIREHPWIGTGPGTFENVYPAYRSAAAAASGIVNRAHSTPLEIAITMGLPFAALVAAVYLWAVVRLGIAAARVPGGSSLLSSAFGAACVVGVHAFFDYSIQIPGCALFAAALAGVGYARTLTPALRQTVPANDDLRNFDQHGTRNQT
jgi:O-antigen ligase